MTSALIGEIVLDIVRIWEKLRAGTHYIKLDQTRIQWVISPLHAQSCSYLDTDKRRGAWTANDAD